jgi:hypothetical protein
VNAAAQEPATANEAEAVPSVPAKGKN